MKLRLGRADRILVVGLLAFALFFRLATLMIIHTGVDERDYWFSAKAIARGLPYPDLSHRTTRFAVILPVALVQALFGGHPNVYYVLPVLNSMLQAGLAFVIGLRLRGRLTGFLAALAITLFPYMIRAGSQVRPEIFSVTYILLAMLFFIEYMQRDQKEVVPLLWTAAWLFIAYEAKITNIYFLPGLLIAVLAYKRRPAHALLLCGVLLSLVLLETGAYAAFTPYKLGELEIILKHHIQEGATIHLARFVDLFQRYSRAHLQLYWQIPFGLYAVAAIAYLIRGVDRRISALVLAALGFFAGITFEVAGFRPLTPAEPFINRYFTAVLGPVFLVLACAAEGIVASRSERRKARKASDSARWWIAALGVGAAAVLALFSFPGLPAGMKEYANSPLHPDRHPLALNERYRRTINRAFEEGMPIVSVTGGGGQNAMETCLAYYIDQSHYVNGRPPAFDRIQRDGSGYLVVGRVDKDAGSGKVLAVVRAPLRIAVIGETDLRNLSDDSFSGGSRSTGNDDE
jgi:hypothetical protein